MPIVEPDALTETQLAFVEKYVGPLRIRVKGDDAEAEVKPVSLAGGSGDGGGGPPDDPGKGEPEDAVDDGSADRGRLALEFLAELPGLQAPDLANDAELGVIGPLRRLIEQLLDYVPSVTELKAAQGAMARLRDACIASLARLRAEAEALAEAEAQARIEAEARAEAAGELLRRLTGLGAPDEATDEEVNAIHALHEEIKGHLAGAPSIKALSDGKEAFGRLNGALATVAERIRLDRMRRIAAAKVLSERVGGVAAPDKATLAEKADLASAAEALIKRVPEFPTEGQLSALALETTALEAKATELTRLVAEDRTPRFASAAEAAKRHVAARKSLADEKLLREADAQRLETEALRLDALFATYADWDKVSDWTAQALTDADNAVEALAGEVGTLHAEITGHLEKIAAAVLAAGKIVASAAPFTLSAAQQKPPTLRIEAAEAKGAKAPFDSAAVIAEIEAVGKEAANLQASLDALDRRIKRLTEAGPDGALKDEKAALTKARQAALDALKEVLA